MLAFARFGPIAVLTNLEPSKESLEQIIHKVPLFLGCAPNFGEDEKSDNQLEFRGPSAGKIDPHNEDFHAFPERRFGQHI